jgi:DNA-binding NarL/FixJ family response regulator
MLIENFPGMEVMYEAASATEALTFADGESPDIVLLDLELGSENGLDFIPRLLSAFSPAKVLVLTASLDTETHQRAISEGASGIVVKEHSPEVLINALRCVHSGELWLGRSLTAAVLTRIVRATAQQSKKDPELEKIATLTPREREIVGLVAQGLNGERIAQQLFISEFTVRNHLTSILDKLQLANKFELAVYASRHGIRSSSPEETREKVSADQVRS